MFTHAEDAMGVSIHWTGLLDSNIFMDTIQKMELSI